MIFSFENILTRYNTYSNIVRILSAALAELVMFTLAGETIYASDDQKSKKVVKLVV